MTWKVKPLGIVVDSSMNPDFVRLKEQGLLFVVIEAGTGLVPAPAFAEQYNKAHAAGLPILAMWIPVPAYDNYVYEQPAKEQIPVILKALAGREIHGIIISAERWWIGMDRENGKTLRPATGNAISYTSNEIIRALVHNFPGMPVLCRSNDGFAKKYSSEMTVWTDQYPFYLADWRYRIRAADGTYTAYTFAPKLTALSLADVFAAMPPDDCKNPLIPGNTPTLRFWEFNGNIWMPLDLVKGWDGSARSTKAVLFNGTQEDLIRFLGVPVGDPGDSNPQDGNEEPTDPTPPNDPGNTGAMEETLSRITELCTQIAADLHAIRVVFRE